MSTEGLGAIHLEGEKLLAIDDVLGTQKARELANAHKTKAFGMLAGLINRPKDEDIEITYEEKRFEAFWYVLGTSRFEYTRRKQYRVPVDPMVKRIEILNTQFTSASNSFHIEGVEHCMEEFREEELVNAQSGEREDFKKYLTCNSKQISSTDELSADGTPIVALQAKPASLIRKVVNALIKPIQADRILDEKIRIDALALYFFPIYTFELYWKTKDKRVTVSFDGATGELRPQANRITERLRTSFTSDEIFEFGKEVANFIPGGGLAMMLGKKAIDLTKKERE